jgi:hypothetical protein
MAVIPSVRGMCIFSGTIHFKNLIVKIYDHDNFNMISIAAAIFSGLGNYKRGLIPSLFGGY